MDLFRTMLHQDSLRELENMSKRLNSVLAARNAPAGERQETMASADWVPLVDVVETESEFLLLAELPGVRKSDVKLSIQSGVLTLSGHREQPEQGKGERHHRTERSYGRFARSFAVPDLVDEQKLSAEFKDGILTVHLPKAEKAKPRSVDVKVT
jgi:HSP20 family protein